MGIYYQVFIECDVCYKVFQGKVFDQGRLPTMIGSKELAKAAGWDIKYNARNSGGNKITCPECKGKI